jgi:hypothetical protein
MIGFNMYNPIEIKALPDYRIWIKYDNGVEGIVNLSNYVGKGVFSIWNDYSIFNKVFIRETGEIAWNDQIDLCPDSLYLKIVGKTPEEIFPVLKGEISLA